MYRYIELTDRKLRGPGARHEMRELREQIGRESAALDRLSSELRSAGSVMSDREQFLALHVQDEASLKAVDQEIESKLSDRIIG